MFGMYHLIRSPRVVTPLFRKPLQSPLLKAEIPPRPRSHPCAMVSCVPQRNYRSAEILIPLGFGKLQAMVSSQRQSHPFTQGCCTKTIVSHVCHDREKAERPWPCLQGLSSLHSIQGLTIWPMSFPSRLTSHRSLHGQPFPYLWTTHPFRKPFVFALQASFLLFAPLTMPFFLINTMDLLGYFTRQSP